MNRETVAVAAVAIGAYVLSKGGEAVPFDIPQNPFEELPSEIQTFAPVSMGGEVGISDNGVTYDDPETGPMNDEPGDDSNVSFEEVNTNSTVVDDTDPETYAPDVEGDTTAPDSGVLADAGGSQNYGSAGEQENDDLTERAADSNMTDSMKSAFDRLANYDDPENL